MEFRLHVSANPYDALAAEMVRVLQDLEAPNIALSGGSTPQVLFRLLTDPEYHGRIDWSRVGIWQVDERCVPPDHPDSNWRMISESLLSEIEPRLAERMPAEREDGAEGYEARIHEAVAAGEDGLPRFDLVLLGMGDDGHLASLFPGTDALEETQRLIVRNHVPHLNTHRMTMTYPLLHAAARRWFLVRGSSKARAFARVQRGALPAGQLAQADWYLTPDVVQS